jgi:transposase-like protein
MNKINKINKEKLNFVLSLTTDFMIELLKSQMELHRQIINLVLESEVEDLAGERYSHDKPNEGRYSRWGSNTGSVRIGSEKLPVEVPRVYDNEEKRNKPLESYQEIKQLKRPGKEVLEKIILGISQRDYERVSRQMEESFGLSQSSVSRRFIEASEQALKEFESRDISGKDIIAIEIDGKALAKQEILIVLGITMKGEKITLGFAQSHTENNRAIKQLLKQIINRGLDYSKGILVVSDGSKAIKKAIKEVFGQYHLHQRCQWHKREDIESYLSSEEEVIYRKKLQRAYREPEYDKAKEKLLNIRDELKQINISAARSLEEGLEETLTLHKLGLIEEFGASLGTTNCIESLNSQLGRYIRKVTKWQNSGQIFRWVACGLLESERRMKKIRNHKQLKKLREKIMLTLKIKATKSKSKVA